MCESVRTVAHTKGGTTLSEGSFDQGTSDEVVQSEKKFDENKSEYCNTFNLFQNSYL